MIQELFVFDLKKKETKKESRRKATGGKRAVKGEEFHQDYKMECKLRPGDLYPGKQDKTNYSFLSLSLNILHIQCFCFRTIIMKVLNEGQDGTGENIPSAPPRRKLTLRTQKQRFLVSPRQTRIPLLGWSQVHD